MSRIRLKSSALFRAVIMGAPGCGKGTISARIQRRYPITYLAAGDVMRRHVAEKTPMGSKLSEYLGKGGLVPDTVSSQIILEELEKIDNEPWLLDGFPRTIPQADALDACYAPNAVLHLIVPFEIIMDRLKSRWVHIPSGRVYNLHFNPPKTPEIDDVTGEKLTQREDDKPETVQKRLKIYSEQTAPLLEYYARDGILHEFAGETSNEIWPLVRSFLDTRHIGDPVAKPKYLSK